MPKFQLPYSKNIQESNQNRDQKILYQGARIIDPASNFDEIGDLLTIGDKIADFGKNLVDSLGKTDSISNNINSNHDFQAPKIIDCQGMVLAPGLIDMQVHFREPGQIHKEDLSSGSMSAVAGGITAVVCQPNTSPVLDSAFLLDYLRLKAKETAYCNILAYGCISRGMKGEELVDMKALKNAGAVGFTDDGLPVMNANLMRKAFESSRDLDLVVAQHAEDLNLTNKGCINEGEVSMKLGVRGIPNISESVIVERDLAILEQTGGRYHLLHCSTRQALAAMKRAKEKGLNATVEAAPHHFILNDSKVLECRTNAKMNPPLRSENDRLALIEGLKSGLIDCIATDHAPHDLLSKNLPLEQASFGIVGVETMLPLALSLYFQYGMKLVDILAKMTCNPAKIIGFDGGKIKKGGRADLVLIDLNHEWSINSQQFFSKSKNSPFDGMKVKGRAVRTVVSGVCVFST